MQLAGQNISPNKRQWTTKGTKAMVRGIHYLFLPSRVSGSQPFKKEALMGTMPVNRSFPTHQGLLWAKYSTSVLYGAGQSRGLTAFSCNCFLKEVSQPQPSSAMVNDSCARQADTTHRRNSASVHLALCIEVVGRTLG